MFGVAELRSYSWMFAILLDSRLRRDRPAQQVKKTTTVAASVRMAETRTSQIPALQLALLSVLEPLTLRLMMPKTTKSHARATTVTRQARAETREATKEPRVPAPRHRMKAMKQRPVATGCNTKTLVNALEVFSEALENSVPSTAVMTWAGL